MLLVKTENTPSMPDARHDFAEVAVALPVHPVYTYAIPARFQDALAVGMRVLAPFGHRKVTGYVLGFPDKAPDLKIKPIIDAPDSEPLFPANMVPFFHWMSRYYKHPVGETIKAALPGGLNQYEFLSVRVLEAGRKALGQGIVTPAEKDILQILETRREGVLLKKLDDLSGGKPQRSLVTRMERIGWVSSEKQLRGGRTRHLTVKYARLAEDANPNGRTSPGPVKERLLSAIGEAGEISVDELKGISSHAARHVKELEELGLVASVSRREFRDPLGAPIERDTPPELNREQQIVVSSVLENLSEGFRAYLLAGVTGSGKTEVYLRLAAEVVGRRKSVLILTPEIALISQMVRRFRARFGDSLSILHSGLSDGERLDQWVRIKSGLVDIAIGARSAIFAPFENPGLIIVDEEHDTSYKQDARFRYNARDLAVVRAMQCRCSVVLGSATPSLQSYHNVKVGKFAELTLKKRIENRPLAEIAVVDLRENKGAKGVGRFFTPQLADAMEKTLERKEQILLFLNRRGFASYPVCSVCGQAIRCKNCEITLTLHKSFNAYQCHFCGYSMAASSACPNCGATRIVQLGMGTEKIEEAAKKMFPRARTVRMDRDTTRRKGSLAKILKDLRDGNIDILVGTQMVAKGHDFPNITLVGIVCADLSLGFPDFRAGERTFQLLAQVAGRAGRGQTPGKVVLQTYNPNHYSITAAKEQDFLRFYNQEIVFRKALSYPPFSRLAQLAISGRDKKETGRFAQSFGELLLRLQASDPEFVRHVEILGPIEAPLAKIDGNYRWQVLLKGLKTSPLHAFVNRLAYRHQDWFANRRIKVAVDMDPYFML